MVNFGSLAAEISSGILGTPANFNGFHMFALLLHWPRSLETDQTLHDVWLSPGLVHYMYIFGSSCPLTEFAMCKIHFTSKSCVLVYWHAALLHGTPAAGISQTLWHGTRNGIIELLQWTPPIFGWAAITLGSAHILVCHCFDNYTCMRGERPMYSLLISSIKSFFTEVQKHYLKFTFV